MCKAANGSRMPLDSLSNGAVMSVVISAAHIMPHAQMAPCGGFIEGTATAAMWQP